MKYFIITNENIKINLQFRHELMQILSEHQLVRDHFEYLFIIGGDGYFMKTVNQFLDDDIKIVFINSGRLGFYSYTNNPNNISEQEIFDEANYIHLDVLNIKYLKNDWKCINDFAYHSNYTSQIQTYINDVKFQNIHGNGILIATPLGSSARNKSLNGALLMPNTNVLTINEVEPINNRFYNSLNAPLVINNDNKIKLECHSYQKWWLLIDGVEYEFKEKLASIFINHNKSKCCVLIKIDSSSWVKKLNYAFLCKE